MSKRLIKVYNLSDRRQRYQRWKAVASGRSLPDPFAIDLTAFFYRQIPGWAGGKRSSPPSFPKQANSFTIDGMLGGLLTSGLLLFNLHYQFYIPLNHGLLLLLATIIPITIAFSKEVRCLGLLWLMTIVSTKAGRQSVTLLMLLVALQGHAPAFASNARSLAHSLHCLQNVLEEEEKSLYEPPTRALVEPLRQFEKEIHRRSILIDNYLESVRKLSQTLLSCIDDSQRKCYNIFTTLNVDTGSAHHICISAVNKIETQLKDKCEIFDIAQWVTSDCSLVSREPLLPTVSNFSFTKNTLKGMNQFAHSLHQDLEMTLEVTDSKGSEDNYDESENTDDDDTDGLDDILNWIRLLLAILTIASLANVSIQTYAYFKKYFSIKWFESGYLDDHFIDHDFNMYKVNKETVLPLTSVEKAKYEDYLLKKNKTEVFVGFFYIAVVTSLLIWGDITVWAAGHIFNENFCTKINNNSSCGKSSSRDWLVDVDTWNVAGLVVQYFRPTWLNMADGDYRSQCSAKLIPPNPATYLHICALLFVAGGFLTGLGKLRSSVISSFYPESAAVRHKHFYEAVLRNRHNSTTLNVSSLSGTNTGDTPKKDDISKEQVIEKESVKVKDDPVPVNDIIVMVEEIQKRQEEEINGNISLDLDVIRVGKPGHPGKLDSRYKEIFDRPPAPPPVKPPGKILMLNSYAAQRMIFSELNTRVFEEQCELENPVEQMETEESAAEDAAQDHLSIEYQCARSKPEEEISSAGPEVAEGETQRPFIFGVSRNPSCTTAASVKSSKSKEIVMKRFHSATSQGSLMAGAIRRMIEYENARRTETRVLMYQPSSQPSQQLSEQVPSLNQQTSQEFLPDEQEHPNTD